jgi:hypothetical protein
MIKSTRYRITFALLVATLVVVGGSLALGAATAGRMGTSVTISVKTKIEKSTHAALENIFFVQEPSAKNTLLRMVQIRTTSSRGLKQLRKMHLDIVNIRPDPERPPGEELFSGGYIVEAVVTKGELAKLKKMGYEISEMPEKN